MRTKFPYCLFFLLSCSGACVNPNFPAKPTTYMNREFKDYTDFKSGSFWIYQEVGNTANHDSIVLSSHHLYIRPAMDGQDGPGPAEEFKDTFKSSLYGVFSATGHGTTNDYQVLYNSWPNSEFIYYTPINGVQLDEWGNLTMTNASENLTIADKTFPSVKEFTIDPNGGYKVVSPITHIWWAKSVGIVQKTVSGTTWQLIRYHVAQ
jgi:hypothetical protein